MLMPSERVWLAQGPPAFARAAGVVRRNDGILRTKNLLLTGTVNTSTALLNMRKGAFVEHEVLTGAV